MPMTLSPTRILMIILLEGFVTISLEILTIRQLIPMVGNSIIVTSLIIGIFLLCLAYGYRAGGLQNKNLIESLQRNFLCSAMGIGIGLSYTQLENGQKGRLLSINGSASSFIDGQKQGFSYIEYIKNILFYELKLKNKNILVLGAGGFSLSAAGTFTNHFTYVDIDPAIYSLVKRYFLNPIQGNFITADARQFVKLHPHGYDVIVSDAYSNTQSIPAHLLTREHFANIKQALKPQGFAIFNIIANPLLNTAYAKRLDNTIRSVFSSCSASPLQFTAQRPVNIIYVCQVNAEEADKTIYTDDHNWVSIDYFVSK